LFLLSIKNYFKKIVVVFGCGGDRDKLKRPKMMKAAIGNASKIIFTSDNSRSESFNSIFNDALKGNNHEKVISIEDRREAIIQGSKLIDKDDCLVILGKGHEETQEASGKKVFFSDHGVVNEIYK
jgi:UDP-N-acetylmuramyl tripeptide synthase